MYLRSAFLPLLISVLLFQAQGDSFRRHYEAAQSYQRAGNFAAAEAEFKIILAESYLRLGRIYSAEEKYQLAADALQAATSITPNSTDGLVDLSIAYFHTAEFSKAVEPLQRAIAADGQNSAAHHMLGKTYFMMGDFDKAAAELQTALKLSPGDYDAEYTLGLAHLKKHDVAAAKQLYDGMAQRLGNRPAVRVLIGRAYRETGFLPESIDQFKQAIALDPKFPRVHYYLGLTYLYKDGAARINDAMEEFKVELAANPDEYFANFYLGILYIMDRKWDEAIALLEKAVQKQPNNPDPYFHLGQAYQGAGKHQQAIEVLQKTIALNPSLDHNDYQVTTAHYRLGQSLLKVGRTAAGEKELQTSAGVKSKGFKMDEKKVGAFISGTALPNQKGNTELVKAEGVVAEAPAGALKTLDKLRSEEVLFSKFAAAAHNSIGLLKAQQEDFREAAVQFAQAAKLNPGQAGLNYNLGLAYYKSENYKDEIPALENELKVNQNNINIKQLLGLSYFATENY